MKKYDVTALGELLIDFTENGTSIQGNPLFEANPGGAPCNVLAMLEKLGHPCAFIGKVGRDFSFYRNPGADMMLTEEEMPEGLLKDTKIFHFGTLSMTHEGVRKATKKALHIAKESGALISFDPNLRPPLWGNMEEAREQVLYGLQFCDVLKISDNEIQWLTGKEDYTKGVEWIREQYPIPLILVSMGKEGSRAYYQGKMVESKPFLRADTIETTGAGDTFCGCVLHYLLEHGIEDLQEDGLQEMLTFANAAASLITTKKGALRVMQGKEEIVREIAANKK